MTVNDPPPLDFNSSEGLIAYVRYWSNKTPFIAAEGHQKIAADIVLLEPVLRLTAPVCSAPYASTLKKVANQFRVYNEGYRAFVHEEHRRYYMRYNDLRLQKHPLWYDVECSAQSTPTGHSHNGNVLGNVVRMWMQSYMVREKDTAFQELYAIWCTYLERLAYNEGERFWSIFWKLILVDICDAHDRSPDTYTNPHIYEKNLHPLSTNEWERVCSIVLSARPHSGIGLLCPERWWFKSGIMKGFLKYALEDTLSNWCTRLRFTGSVRHGVCNMFNRERTKTRTRHSQDRSRNVSLERLLYTMILRSIPRGYVLGRFDECKMKVWDPDVCINPWCHEAYKPCRKRKALE